ncbi:hypothetical protein [Ferrimicrobium sp.]|uniref:hypothetical protein n=1 Tax=Ferrimicrobium sp. TaxID=2926050 RepID=UPI00260765C7|nr:hypothetical protein [Ferrimicrobium sp.]
MASEVEILEAEIKAHQAMIAVKAARFDRDVPFNEFWELVGKFAEAVGHWEALKDGANDGRPDFEQF